MKKIIFSLTILVAVNSNTFAKKKKNNKKTNTETIIKTETKKVSESNSNIETLKPNKFEEQLGVILQKMNTSSFENLTQASEDFSIFTTRFPKEWLATYYNVYSKVVLISKTSTKKELNTYFEKIDASLRTLEAENDETLVLKSLVNFYKIKLLKKENLLTESLDFLNSAQNINEENPRIYYVRAMLYNLSVNQIAENTDITKNNVVTAINKYQTFHLKNNLMPNWGNEEAEFLLNNIGK